MIARAPALQLIQAAPAMRDQHYLPPGRALAEHPLLCAILAAQGVAVAAGLRAHWAAGQMMVAGERIHRRDHPRIAARSRGVGVRILLGSLRAGSVLSRACRSGLAAADNEAGWRSSLAKLAALAESARTSCGPWSLTESGGPATVP
jgi:hypothetical protein